MWFDELMDDCKQALQTAVEHKGIFIPILVSGVVNLAALIIIFAAALILVIASLGQIGPQFNFFSILQEKLPVVITLLIGMYIVFTVVSIMIEVGSVNLYKMAVEGYPLKTTYFFDGVKKYFFKAFGFTLLFHLLCLILFVPIVALFLLYSLTIGIMTAGWGVTIVFVIAQVYFGAWTIALIIDDSGPFKALASCFNFGRRNFIKLFILVLASTQLSQFVFSAFGPLISIAAGWFISGAVIVYFKLTTMLIYRKQVFPSNATT